MGIAKKNKLELIGLNSAKQSLAGTEGLIYFSVREGREALERAKGNECC